MDGSSGRMSLRATPSNASEETDDEARGADEFEVAVPAVADVPVADVFVAVVPAAFAPANSPSARSVSPDAAPGEGLAPEVPVTAGFAGERDASGAATPSNSETEETFAGEAESVRGCRSSLWKSRYSPEDSLRVEPVTGVEKFGMPRPPAVEFCAAGFAKAAAGCAALAAAALAAATLAAAFALRDTAGAADGTAAFAGAFDVGATAGRIGSEVAATGALAEATGTAVAGCRASFSVRRTVEYFGATGFAAAIGITARATATASQKPSAMRELRASRDLSDASIVVVIVVIVITVSSVN